MERAELDQLLQDLIEERLSKRQANELLHRITSDPEVARAYAEMKLATELRAELDARRETRRAARLRSRQRTRVVGWFRRFTRWNGRE